MLFARRLVRGDTARQLSFTLLPYDARNKPIKSIIFESFLSDGSGLLGLCFHAPGDLGRRYTHQIVPPTRKFATPALSFVAMTARSAAAP